MIGKSKMKRIVLLCLVALLFAGCLGGSVKKENEPVVGEGLKISFIANRDNSNVVRTMSANFHSPQDYTDNVFTSEMYREPLNSEKKGRLVGQYTPHSMIVSLDRISIESERMSRPLTLHTGVRRSESSGWGMLPNFDLAYADQVLDASYVLEGSQFDFDVVRINFFTRTFGFDESRGPNRELSFVGEVRVDLGPDYEGVMFENTKEIRDGIHIFEFADLIPLPGREKTRVASIAFDHNVTKPFIINPDGEHIGDFRPTFWDSPTRWGFGGYMVYNPGLELDLRKSNHLIFEYDLVDLIEIYDQGKPDEKEKHLVTFKLANPFPIKFYMEQTEPGEREWPSEVPLIEVEHLDAGYFDLMKREVLIKWTNPPLETFKQVRIVRHIQDEPQESKEVYVGKHPIFQDFSVEEGKTYVYEVFVEDIYGNVSLGQSIVIKTEPPQADSIVLLDSKTYQTLSDQISISINEEKTILARGRNEYGHEIIAPVWKVDNENILLLRQNKGEYVEIKALEKGEAILSVELPESFGGASATLTVIVE